jgi:hypothetical protein
MIFAGDYVFSPTICYKGGNKKIESKQDEDNIKE